MPIKKVVRPATAPQPQSSIDPVDAAILRKYPGGIAAIVPIYDAIEEPMVRPIKPEDRRKARTTSVILTIPEAAGTHPVTGYPMTDNKSYDLVFYPSEIRTNTAGQINKKHSPLTVLKYLLAHDGHGQTFQCIPVPQLILDREKEALKNPEARRILKERARGEFSNPQPDKKLLKTEIAQDQPEFVDPPEYGSEPVDAELEMEEA